MENANIEAGKSYENLSNEDYHKGPGLSSTDIKTINKKSYNHWLYEKQNRKFVKAFQFGTLVHTALLEPHLMKDQYIRFDECETAPSRSTKAGKEIFKKYCEEPGHNVDTKMSSDEWKSVFYAQKYPGKEYISRGDQRILDGIMESVDKHPTLQGYLDEGKPEVSYYGKCPVTGELLKSRPDLTFGDTFLDLKTCQDASIESFSSDIINRDYHISAVFHMDVAAQCIGKIRTYGWIAIEKTPPYGISYIYLPEEYVEFCRAKIKKSILKYREGKRLQETGEYTGYTPDWQSAIVKKWAIL